MAAEKAGANTPADLEPKSLKGKENAMPSDRPLNWQSSLGQGIYFITRKIEAFVAESRERPDVCRRSYNLTMDISLFSQFFGYRTQEEAVALFMGEADAWVTALAGSKDWRTFNLVRTVTDEETILEMATDDNPGITFQIALSRELRQITPPRRQDERLAIRARMTLCRLPAAASPRAKSGLVAGVGVN